MCNSPFTLEFTQLNFTGHSAMYLGTYFPLFMKLYYIYLWYRQILTSCSNYILLDVGTFIHHHDSIHTKIIKNVHAQVS